MNNIKVIIVAISIFLAGCNSTENITRNVAYSRFYEENPVSILLMPPINRSTNVDAKEIFHSSLQKPLANRGYYVIPTFLSMEILKKESAYDAELLINQPLSKFRNFFGADLALFTIIHRWDKSSLASKVFVKIEYIIKSTITNETIYSRTGEIIVDTSVNGGYGNPYGAVVTVVASAIKTATTKYIDVARTCNDYTFRDLPEGKYSPLNGLDGDLLAGKKSFKVRLKAK
jgi:hypothetical protein